MIKKISVVFLALILVLSFSCFADISLKENEIDKERVEFDTKNVGANIIDNKLLLKKEILTNRLELDLVMCLNL